MNRLHKKCFVASTGVHVLLMVILFVGPAFLAPPKQAATPEFIDFVPSILVDGLVPPGGGNPNAAPPAAQPPQPTPPAPQPPPPAPAPDPEPPEPKSTPKTKAPDPTPEVKENRPDPDSLEVAKPKTPKVSLKVHTAKTSSTLKNQKAAAAKAERERAEAAERARTQLAGRLLANAASGIRAGTGSATTVEEYGPGGGGPTYASYASEVQRVYRDAWAPPEDTANDDAITKATVTIASDGRVISARISRASGDVQVDNSVRFTLERVKFIAPFPDGAKDKQRTYIINFNLKVKRGLA